MTPRKSRRTRGTRRTLAVLGVAAFCLAVALPLFADEGGRAMRQAASIGSARSAWEAPGIELRDSRNRPISRAALAKGLRGGSSRVEKQAAGLSKLPHLKALLDYLDRLDLSAALRDLDRAQRPSERAVLPEPVRPPKARACAGPAEPAADPDARMRVASLQFTCTPGRLLVVPMLE